MPTRTKTKISLEKRQRTTIRLRRRLIEVWCGQCAAEVQMMPPETAAALAGTTPRLIYRRVENGELHFLETREGELLVCRNSLIAGSQQE